MSKAKKNILFAALAALAALLWGLRAISRGSSAAGLAAAQSALHRSVMQCYAIEGSYPASISHLEDVYGLAINRNDYTVNYEWFADNVPPTVTVVAR